MTTELAMNQQDTIIPVNNIELWVEEFGDRKNFPIILIMGSGGQGILWPTEFCRALAHEGYFVLRFDSRDTGLSSSIDFNNHPYTLLDMANDVIGILDHYQFPDAHLVGASMGGAISMILAAHYPERIRTLTLLATSIDFRPAMNLFLGITATHSLPPPSPKIIEAARKFTQMSCNTLEEKIQLFVETAKMNSGSLPVDEELCRQLAILNFERMKNPASPQNHMKAIFASHDLHRNAINKISAPTHIVHGDEDPIFPLEHGKATQAAIPGSTLCIIPGLGHNFSCRELMMPIIREIVSSVKKSDEAV